MRHLLIIGGKAGQASASTETLNTESTKTNKWAVSPELPEARESMSSVLFSDGSVCIYGGVLDGLVGEKNVFCSRQPFESSKMFETAPWTLVGELLESRREHTSILHHSKSKINLHKVISFQGSIFHIGGLKNDKPIERWQYQMNFTDWADKDLAGLATGNKIEEPAVFVVGSEFNCSISIL